MVQEEINVLRQEKQRRFLGRSKSNNLNNIESQKKKKEIQVLPNHSKAMTVHSGKGLDSTEETPNTL